uniref:Mitochondrial fission 1 protein n=1 Tax=Spongospora subterranea TaxID=70186 RepID=A0A0H5R5A9_9EUKA|eukprot:CRZ09350.1 hypothetical protein [Spongospora subterranea]
MTVQDKDDVEIEELIEGYRLTWAKEREKEFPDAQVHLEFSTALLRSNDRNHLLEAQDNLDDMIEEGLSIVDSCYAQAVCKFKLGLLSESSIYTSRVLQLDPNNEKAQQLQDILETTASKEGKLTALLSIGVTFALAALLHAKFLKPFFSRNS